MVTMYTYNIIHTYTLSYVVIIYLDRYIVYIFYSEIHWMSQDMGVQFLKIIRKYGFQKNIIICSSIYVV